jgi:transcriptional regulator with XRE-family HTH domain
MNKAMDDEVLTRAEILGGLIRDARTEVGQSIEECAGALGKSIAEYSAFESGDQAPSLPELEVLAMFLKVPMSHFWGSSPPVESAVVDYSDYLHLRKRMIGALLSQSRINLRKTVDELALETGISADIISRYEDGSEAVPYFELETMATKLDFSVKHFVDDEHGPLAEYEAEREIEQRFTEWSPQMKSFVADSRNISYLETAMRLSEMDVDKLRTIAEGILEITL